MIPGNGCDIEPALCAGCGLAIGALFATLVISEMKAPVCSKACADLVTDEEAKRIACEHCGKPTSPEDRTPTAAGGVADSGCRLKLANAYAGQRGAVLGGRGLHVVRGGRS